MALDSGVVLVSDDGGGSFRRGPTLSHPGAFGGGAPIEGFAQSGRSVFAVASDGSAYLSHDTGTTWAGETWCAATAGSALGWGEIAAFDSRRAVAGGPACLSTRTGDPVPLQPGG